MYRPLWMTYTMYIKIVPYTNTIRHNLVRTTRITHIVRLFNITGKYTYVQFTVGRDCTYVRKQVVLTSSISLNFKICPLGVIVLYYFKVLALFPFNYLSFL